MVPIQETEAWLLLDKGSFRRVAGKPKVRTPLDLPTPTNVENIANPKELLKESILIASETTGRRYEGMKKECLSFALNYLQICDQGNRYRTSLRGTNSVAT